MFYLVLLNIISKQINFEESDVRLAIEAVERGRVEQSNQGQQEATPVQAAVKQEEKKAATIPQQDDDFDESLPFWYKPEGNCKRFPSTTKIGRD